MYRLSNNTGTCLHTLSKIGCLIHNYLCQKSLHKNRTRAKTAPGYRSCCGSWRNDCSRLPLNTAALLQPSSYNNLWQYSVVYQDKISDWYIEHSLSLLVHVMTGAQALSWYKTHRDCGSMALYFDHLPSSLTPYLGMDSAVGFWGTGSTFLHYCMKVYMSQTKRLFWLCHKQTDQINQPFHL